MKQNKTKKRERIRDHVVLEWKGMEWTQHDSQE